MNAIQLASGAPDAILCRGGRAFGASWRLASVCGCTKTAKRLARRRSVASRAPHGAPETVSLLYRSNGPDQIQNMCQLPVGGSVGFAWHNLLVAYEELGRAGPRAANDGQQSADLFARHQSQLTARWARQDSPVGILLFAHLAGVLQNENGSRLHLFGDPLVQHAQFSDHVPSFRRPVSRRLAIGGVVGPFKKLCCHAL